MPRPQALRANVAGGLRFRHVDGELTYDKLYHLLEWLNNRVSPVAANTGDFAEPALVADKFLCLFNNCFELPSRAHRILHFQILP